MPPQLLALVGCSASLGGHDSEFAGRHLGQGGEDRRCQRCEGWQTGSRRAEHDDPERTAAEILLKAEILICSDKRIVFLFRRVEQRAIIQVRPLSHVDAVHAVARQECAERTRQIGIEEHAHSRARLRGRRARD